MDTEFTRAQGTFVSGAKFCISSSNSLLLFGPPPMGRFSVPACQFAVRYASIQNRSGGLAVVGYGARIPPAEWKLGTWTNAESRYGDITVAAEDDATSDVPLETLTNNDGHIVASRYKFTCIDYLIGTAAASATSSIRTMEYSRADGVWTALTPIIGPVSSATAWAVGERAILFAAPNDWAPMTAAHGTGVPIGYYGLRVLATTAPTTTSASATRVTLGDVADPVEGLADQNIAEWAYNTEVPFTGDAMGFFLSRDLGTTSVTLTTGSRGTLLVKVRG